MKGQYRIGMLLALLVFCLGAPSAIAQVDYSTGTLRGTVTDPQKSVVSGATVTVTNTRTGSVRTTKTDSGGEYIMPGLQPDKYTVTIDSTGMQKDESKGVEVSVGQMYVHDVQMRVSGSTPPVESEGRSTPAGPAEQSQQANTVNQLQIEQLPNTGHAMTQQIYTLPGVSNSNAARAQNPGFTFFGDSGYSIGGLNGRNISSTVDSGESDSGTGAYRVATIPQESIQEYQVNRNSFGPQFGFTDGSTINIVTKSGGNQLHGSVYGYFEDHAISAQNFFNGLDGFHSAYSQNSFTGFTLGGPIKKDKLFFFLSYDYRNLANPDYSNAAVLAAPTVTGPNAAQVAYVNALKASGNPFLIGFANGITPGLTPLNNPALSQILTAEDGVAEDRSHFHNTALRLDATPNSTDSFNVRLNYSHDDTTTNNPDSNGLFTRDFGVLAAWNHTISPSALNQLLIQVVPRNIDNVAPTAPFQGVNFTLGSLLPPGGLGNTSSFGSPSVTPYLAHQQRFQFEDNLNVTIGHHALKFGVSLRLADYGAVSDSYFNPQFDFKDGAVQLISLAPAAVQAQLVGFNLSHGFPATGPGDTNLSAPQAFAFGLPSDFLAGFGNPTWQGWGKYFAMYAEDSWRVNSRLTLNGGARVDVEGEPHSVGTRAYVSPRLGLAWDPFGDHKTVVRAGGGIFVAPVNEMIPLYGSLLNGTGQYINIASAALSPTNPQAAQLWQLGIAGGHLPFGHLTPGDFASVGINTTPAGATATTTVAANFRNPYSLQASLSIARELGHDFSVELAYNMNHGVFLPMPLETGYQQIALGNPSCPSLTVCTDVTGGPLYAPIGSRVQQTTFESNGSSIYHAMTASITKRYSHGFQFQVNYTWSKGIDNVIDFSGADNWFRPGLLRQDRTVSVFDIPQLLTANVVYRTPFKSGTRKVQNIILADISVSGIETFHSGTPFSIRTPNLLNKTNGSLLDNNFATPFGVSRDSLRGPVFVGTDLSFTKAFYINREHGVSLNVIAIGTNIFNRTNFNRVSDAFDVNGISPSGAVTTAVGTVNLITGPFTGLHGVKPTSPTQITQPLFYSGADLPRQIQFGLRLVF